MQISKNPVHLFVSRFRGKIFVPLLNFLRPIRKSGAYLAVRCFKTFRIPLESMVAQMTALLSSGKRMMIPAPKSLKTDSCRTFIWREPVTHYLLSNVHEIDNYVRGGLMI
ncbi:hypothetical protein TNCV_2395721 [Trichonephila clavipes]|nr:hypothetical protein TNCV_2395721 [Trichonephila clavipes]